MTSTDYTNNVFINCPFDPSYSEMLDAIIFTVFDCGYRPRCALEIDDAGDIRINKITQLIKDSAYGFHDISCTELDEENGLPRFNMPLELGLFIGALKFGDSPHSTKRVMIVDKEQYRYQKYISDIAGQDIRSHGDKIENIITIIRNWLRSSCGRVIPSGPIIRDRYSEFRTALPALLEALNLHPEGLTYLDKCDLISIWLSTNPTPVPVA